MASVLQRLGLLDDATTVMEVAITFNRANLLYHYILAGIYVVCMYVHTYICTYVCSMCVCMYLCTVCTVFIHIKAGLIYLQGLNYTLDSAAE